MSKIKQKLINKREGKQTNKKKERRNPPCSHKPSTNTVPGPAQLAGLFPYLSQGRGRAVRAGHPWLQGHVPAIRTLPRPTKASPRNPSSPSFIPPSIPIAHLSSGLILSSQAHAVTAASASLTRPPASPAYGSKSWRFAALYRVRSGHWKEAGSCVADAVFVFFVRPSPSRHHHRLSGQPRPYPSVPMVSR